MAEKKLVEIKIPAREINLNIAKKELKLNLPKVDFTITPSIVVLALSVAIAGLILALHFGFAGYQAWRMSTGYREMNQYSYKPQEIKYPDSPEETVQVIGNEPDVTTRDQAMVLTNPVKPTKKTLKEGKEFFEIYCSPCHGKNGEGQGIMGQIPALGEVSHAEEQDLSQYMSGFLPYKPDLDMNVFRKEQDSQLYYTITEGGEIIMPKFYDALDPDQRWKIVNYIKRGLGKSGI